MGDDFKGYITKNEDLSSNIWNKKDFDMCGLGEKNRFIPDMLQDLRDNRSGSPSYLGENYTNEEGIFLFIVGLTDKSFVPNKTLYYYE